jgi:hypothetical protein
VVGDLERIPDAFSADTLDPRSFTASSHALRSTSSSTSASRSQCRADE